MNVVISDHVIMSSREALSLSLSQIPESETGIP